MPLMNPPMPPGTCKCGDRIEDDGHREYVHSDTNSYFCLGADGKTTDRVAVLQQRRRHRKGKRDKPAPHP